MKLNEYDRFPDQAVDEEGNMIEEAMLAESEPTDLNQAMKDPN